MKSLAHRLLVSIVLNSVAIMNCDDPVTSPAQGELSPLDATEAIGVWRVFKEEIMVGGRVESSELIDESSTEQTFLEIDSSLEFFSHGIYERIDCTEDYPWDPMTCDTLPPCRAAYNVTEFKDAYSWADPCIVQELYVMVCTTTKVERRFMERYLKPFPPVEYQDTCIP
jgi:hypothetical protein